MNHRVDVVGDIHGHYDALESLGSHLGYDVQDGWAHRDGRALVFLGNLVDGGEHSLEVCELVLSLVRSGRALCLMGNHEYNLVRYNFGLEKKKKSNEKTVKDLGAQQKRWAAVLEFLRALPLAIDLPELRLIHAMWHQQHYGAVGEVIHQRHARAATALFNTPDTLDTIDWLRSHVSLASPFDESGLRRGLPSEKPAGQDHSAHEILIKGAEHACVTFVDADGQEREMARDAWWADGRPVVPRDKVTVFGHYRNLPPIPGRHDAVAPPHLDNQRNFSAWQTENAKLVLRRGTADAAGDARFICVDYSGVELGGGGPCVGAYRWPEHQVAWART